MRRLYAKIGIKPFTNESLPLACAWHTCMWWRALILGFILDARIEWGRPCIEDPSMTRWRPWATHVGEWQLRAHFTSTILHDPSITEDSHVLSPVTMWALHDYEWVTFVTWSSQRYYGWNEHTFPFLEQFQICLTSKDYDIMCNSTYSLKYWNLTVVAKHHDEWKYCNK